jgi:hypothetical protein
MRTAHENLSGPSQKYNNLFNGLRCTSLAAFSASLPATAPQNLKNPESF